MSVRVIAEQVRGRDLKPGDLFSTEGPLYWAFAMDRGSIGEKVYIRTNSDADTVADADEPIYRITFYIEGEPDDIDTGPDQTTKS